jgi:chromatin remodeling complex protein RSC6
MAKVVSPSKSKNLTPKSKAKISAKGKVKAVSKGKVKAAPKGKIAKNKNTKVSVVDDADEGFDEAQTTNEETDLPEDEETVSGPKKRTKPTIYDHIAHYEQLLNLINGEIDRKSRTRENGGVRILQKSRKMIETMRKELVHITRSKEARAALSTRKKTLSGLTMKYFVSQKLADFLQIDSEVDTVSRVDVIRAVCVYAHIKPDEKREDILVWSYLNPGSKRNLQNPNNKKTILVDRVLSNLFNKKGDDPSLKNGIGYNSIQGLVNHHFLEAVAHEVEGDGQEKEDEEGDNEDIDNEEK